MPASIAVSVRNLSKRYLLYNRPQDRLKQALFWRFGKNYAREFWALRDVSFEVQRGEVLGIVGRNGSGKSTLLQTIAGTLTPTAGEVHVDGRVTALLELGSGFNPEFTGLENVYLNGAILGFGQDQMEMRFEEIAAFADIGQFMDQPVKLYSSGMFVRLAFAVQVLLEPDILIVDEALAVGDAAFQIKCINRMKRLNEDGTTIILVTHDVQTVRSFCHRAIWLHDGSIKDEGSPLEITSRYIQYLFGTQATRRLTRTEVPSSDRLESTDGTQQQKSYDSGIERRLLKPTSCPDLVRWGSGELVIESFAMDNGQVPGRSVFEYGERLHIEFQARALKDVPSSEVSFGFALRNTKGLDIITSTTHEGGHQFASFSAGQVVHIAFDLDNILAPGDYALVLSIGEPPGLHYYDFIENAVLFKVVSKRRIYSAVLPPVQQYISVRSG